jgi:hypothetical protein
LTDEVVAQAREGLGPLDDGLMLHLDASWPA